MDLRFNLYTLGLADVRDTCTHVIYKLHAENDLKK